MEWVIIVLCLALIEYMAFAAMVGWARGKYKVNAPAMSGDPHFERYLRVQQNTGEQLLVFIPSLLLFAQFHDPRMAAGIGMAFVIGRLIYMRAYLADPARRALGFVIGFLANVCLLLGALAGAALALM